MTLYPARVDWQDGDTILLWDGFLESVIEVFGVPGNRYVTALDSNYMDFKFYTEQDRILFLTGWSARILPEQQ
jgi:hypothetical protein